MNIILLISDTFRYDNLFDRAETPVRTPHLDRFAERAVSLSGMYVSSFPTIPHRTDLTSGRYGWCWYPWQDRRQSSENHIPKLLNQEGYVSQLLCDCPHLLKNGFNLDFHGAHVIRGQEGDTYFLRMNHPIESVMPDQKTRVSRHFMQHKLVDIHRWINHDWTCEEDRFPPRTAGLAIEWLEENYKYHPFFLWVDFFDPHEPWDPPEDMVRRYDPDYDGTPMLHPNYGKASDYTPGELKNLRAHYCAEAELVDRWIGRVIEKIDDLGLWSNSIVVFTSDHGMSLGEHNRTGKSNINEADDRCWPMYPETAHIPFMIAAPGLEGGKTVDAMLQPPDILPTLLELAGVDVEPPEPFHGKSFAPMLRGDSPQPLREFAISAQYPQTRTLRFPTRRITPVLYTERWGYAPIGAGREPELYDLGSDPHAETDVAADNGETVRELHKKFMNWLKKMKAPKETIRAFR